MPTKKQSANTEKKTPVHNPALPRVPITLGDTEYHLVYSFNAIAEAERLTGMNLFGSFDFRTLSVTKFRAMLYASLLPENPAITIEEVGDFVTYHNLPEITVKLIEAWTSSRPEVEESPGNAAAEVANLAAAAKANS